MRLRAFIILVLCLSFMSMLGACTKLEVKKYIATEYSADEPPEGAIYYLPKTEISVTVSHVLKKCPYVVQIKKDEFELHFEVDTKASIAVKPIADIESAYLISYRELESISKEFTFDLQYHPNGMIKSVNTTSDDKSADMALSLAKAAGTVALIHGLGPAGLIAAIPMVSGDAAHKSSPPIFSVPIFLCVPNVKSALNNKDEKLAAVKNATKKLKAKIKEIQGLRKSIAEATENAAQLADLKLALAQLSKIQAEFEQASNEYDDLMKLLTIKQTYKFSSTQTESLVPEKGVAIKDQLLPKWVGGSSDVLNAAIEQLTLKFTIPSLPASTNISKGDGIVYRQGALVDIKLCRSDSCDKNKYVATERLFLSDAGPMAVLPFVNEVFQENQFSATFLENGMLQSVKYSSNSQGEVATKSVENIASEYAKYKTQHAQLKQADIQAVYDKNLTDLDQQISLLEKQKELQELTKEENTVLMQLQQEIELRKLLSEIDVMDTEEAQRELDRLIIQQQINDLLKATE